ncbi:MAG: SDR family NAD(P)-dependent oxidoreductase [Oscillospiraceae bacterium]|nr:SDR family NAD(P)-dependent oxidoreductase [Oscillospiraceae bacterium]
MRIAIVTGASSGMGREFVLQLPSWEQFDELWVIARRADRLEALKEGYPFPIRPISLDLTAQESLEHYRALLDAAKPEVALLANVSGFGKFGRYDQIPLEDSLNMIDLNCKALVAVTELTLPYMKRGAHILMLDSLSAFQPVPYLNIYASTKAFVLSYSRSLNRELKPRGIRVMAVSPGWVKTEFFDRATVTSNDAVTYYNRWYEPKDVMKTALRDLYRSRKDVSIHGFPVRMQVRMVKLLPHSLIMNIWMKQQKHNKLPPED